MPLQLLMFCMSCFPLYRPISFWMLHILMWQFISVQYSSMMLVENWIPPSGKFLSISVVTSDHLGALLFFIFQMMSLISLMVSASPIESFVGHWSSLSRFDWSTGVSLLKTVFVVLLDVTWILIFIFFYFSFLTFKICSP